MSNPHYVPMRFNRSPLVLGGRIEAPSQELVSNTLALWNVSAEDAMRYGGDLTRSALAACPIANDRRYVVVDTKVHMLKPGMWPAIPGWHTDGVPRGNSWSPADGVPNIHLQDRAEGEGQRAPRYHLLVTGEGCLTEFVVERNFVVPVPECPSETLYSDMTHFVNATRPQTFVAPSCRVLTWDWWDIHRGVAAKSSEWRFLIRVTETDHLAPQTDPRRFIRTQHNVYVPSEAFGW